MALINTPTVGFQSTALSNITTSMGALSSLIAVTPNTNLGYQPQATPPKDGTISDNPTTILFHYEGEQVSVFKSDITDHYVEDNTAVQDQIALKPEMITTHGFIGELNDVPPSGFGFLSSLTSKLGVLGAYAPGLTNTALGAINTAQNVYSSASKAVNSVVGALSSLSGNASQNVVGSSGITQGSTQNQQQKIFAQFYGYWRNRTLFQVQTPWGVFQNMAIDELRVIQSDETNTVSEFQITFKMIRFSNVAVNPTVVTGRLSAQSASAVSHGAQTPMPSTSLATGVSGTTSGQGVPTPQ